MKAKDIGQYFLYLAERNKKPINNKKLQKLVYYAQAWHLALTKKKLFDEPIEAWVHGPAVRSLYGRYKKYGFEPIREVIDNDIINTIPKKTKEILDSVWNVYGKFDAGYLEMLTHSEDPWLNARNNLQPHESSTNEILIKDMINYYAGKLKKIRSEK